eukprot:scaffold11579_cov40-Cyclotella_meneghiniana.AAC.11
MERLRRDNQEMIDRQQALVNARAGGSSRGHALGRMPMYEGQDQVNYSQVNRLAREMFVQVKHLARDWNIESKDSSSMYQRIIGCGGVTIPEGWDKYVYFKKYLGRYFVAKYRTMRTNYTSRFAGKRDAKAGVVNRQRIFSDLIGNKKTTFTKVLRSADENTDEGREVWERVTELFYYFIMRFVIGLYTKADLRQLIKTNPGQPLPLIMDVSDVAYAFEILENCREVWDQVWHHDPENENGANDASKNAYKKFKKLNKRERAELCDEDKSALRALDLKNYKYTTGTKKTAYGHGITKDGMEFYEKHLLRYGAFLADERMKETFMRYWDKHDEEQGLVNEVIFNGRMNRKSGVIILRGEVGYVDPFAGYESDEGDVANI